MDRLNSLKSKFKIKNLLLRELMAEFLGTMVLTVSCLIYFVCVKKNYIVKTFLCWPLKNLILLSNASMKNLSLVFSFSSQIMYTW